MSRNFRPHLALITVQILFGSWPILGKIVLRSISVTSLVACRLIGAAIALTLLHRQLTPLLKMRRKDFALLVLCAICGVVGNQLLYVKALSLTTVINAALLTTTIPVITLFVSILFGYDNWSLKRVLGIDAALPIVKFLRLEGGGSYFLSPKAGADELASFGNAVTSSGWAAFSFGFGCMAWANRVS